MMFDGLRHPGFRRLNRYVDGDLGDAERARVAAHLARCERCRHTVAKVRALGVAARELPTPAAPPNLIKEVLRRRAKGERVILPVTPPGPPRRRSFLFPIAAAAVVVLAVAIILTIHTPSLHAARGGLTITPARPVAGARLSVDYEDMGRFQGQQQLTLRARYRTSTGPHQLTAGILDRMADGHFRGTVTLPDSVVYAAFAVEDPAGRTVDSNGRRFWDVMAHAPDGRPTFAALAARLDDMISRDWEGAFDVARQMTELYPDRPASWTSLDYFERALPGDSAVLLRVRQRLQILKRRVIGENPPDPESMAELAYYYAFVTGQRQESRKLIALIGEQQGWNQVRMRFRLSLSWINAAGDRSRYLASLDSLWTAARGDISLARAGFNFSTETDDPDLIWTWYERLATADPATVVPTLTERLLPMPALRARVIHALERAVAGGEGATESRPLYLSVPEFEREEGREMGRARVLVGAALVAGGRTGEGLVQLRRGAGEAWTPAVLHQAGQILLAYGDTADAVRAYARMAADPVLPAELRRAITTELGALTLSDGWNAGVAAARTALREDILADEINTPIDTDMVLGDASGEAVPLSRLMGRGATVVVFWSRRCLPALDSTTSIERVRRRLATRGIPTIVIATESRSPDMDQDLSRLHIPFPVYTDRDGQATRIFVPPGTPTYYVLDGEGRIRFAYSNLDRLAEQAVMLQNASATPMSTAD